MAELTILQNSLFKDFLLPFFLVWVIIFGILQKSKLFGEGKMQLDAIISAVIGLIIVGVVGPREFISNMMIFLAIAMSIIFVVLLLWGFAVGGDFSKPLTSKGMRWFFGILIGFFVIAAVSYFSGYSGNVSSFLYDQNWSSPFWSSVFFVIVVVVVLAFVLKPKKS